MNSELVAKLKQWRHHLHMYPESAFEEVKAAEYLANELEQMGLTVYKNIGKTGLVATLKVGDSDHVVALRADMDSLKLQEKNKLPYCSVIEDRMHACGHDGHMAMLLGAAQLLIERKNFNGTVCFIFQPAEELGMGAKAMIAEKMIQKFNIQEIYGLHNMPGQKVGTIATRIGGIMAIEDNFVVRIYGVGSHAARPNMGKDPLVAAAEIILAFQTIVSRNVDPNESAVISCTEIHTDGIRNTIPSFVEIKGDTRSYSKEVQQLLKSRMKSICDGISVINDIKCEFEYTFEFTPTINWEDNTKFAIHAAKNIVGEQNVIENTPAVMISEDFGAFLQSLYHILCKFIITNNQLPDYQNGS